MPQQWRILAAVVVDAERQEQLTALAGAVRALQGEKRFLFRSAASMVKALAGESLNDDRMLFFEHNGLDEKLTSVFEARVVHDLLA